MKLHREDFERERRAHEIAIIVKNFAEDRIKKMEREMKDLRDRLQVHMLDLFPKSTWKMWRGPYYGGQGYKAHFQSATFHNVTLLFDRTNKVNP